MDSIASKTVFIPLLLLLPLCKSFVVRLENSVNVDDITWHDPNDINQFFANGDLDFTFTPPEKSSGSETQESSNEENSNEYIINPQVIHVGESNDNSEGEQDEEVHPGEEGCGEGTLCKEERDESMFQREESIKTHILNSLRMTAPPNISEEDKLSIDSPAIRKMLRLRDLDEDYLIPDVNIETTSRNLISAAKRPHFAGNTTNNWFFFNLTSENRNNFRIKDVRLHYYIYPNSNFTDDFKIRLDRYTRNRDGIYETRKHKTQWITQEAVQRNESWMTLSYRALTELVEGWLVNPHTNYGVKLEVNRGPNVMANGFRPNEIALKPYLEIEFEPNNRRKRSSDDISFCRANTTINRCCIFRFEINFAAIGWDWVLAPPVYEANYCAGHCSPIQNTNVPIRLAAAGQSQMSNLAEWKRPKSCCVPKLYAPISLLYYDQQSNIVFSTVPDMKILDCGCA